MATQITTPGTKGFLLWVKTNQPALYQEFLKRWNGISAPMLSGLRGLGDDGSVDPTNPNSPSGAAVIDPATTASTGSTDDGLASMFKNLLTGASQIFIAGKQIDNQSKILDAQLARAKAGLPPLNIDVASYGLQPTVGVGLSPQTKTFLTYGAIGAGLLYLLGVFGRRRAS